MNTMEKQPLAVYIHLPFCKRRCRYCSFVSFSGKEKLIPRYVTALSQEMKMRARPQTVRTIYFGGGTPSLLQPAQLERLTGTIVGHYCLEETAEITLEINPGSVDAGYFKTVGALGINRLSIGVQSLDEFELQTLGRIHDVNQALTAVKDAHRAGFDNISVDLIYGAPGSSDTKWRSILARVIDLPVTHISLYALTVEENTAMGRDVAAGTLKLPSEDVLADEYEIATAILADAGFRQYEISNWAKPGYASRHNLAYWKRTPYLGFGVAAHSFEDTERTANGHSLETYLSALESGGLPPRTVENIDQPTALAETLMLGLRLNEGVAIDDVESRFGVNLLDVYGPQITELEALELLTAETDGIRLTDRGRMLGNEVFMRFLP